MSHSGADVVLQVLFVVPLVLFKMWCCCNVLVLLSILLVWAAVV